MHLIKSILYLSACFQANHREEVFDLLFFVVWYGRLRWKFILRGKNNKKPSYVEGATKIGQNYPVIHLRRAHSNDGGTVIIAN